MKFQHLLVKDHIPIKASKSILSIKNIDNIHTSIARFKNVLRDIKTYSFIPKEIKEESKVGFSLELSRTERTSLLFFTTYSYTIENTS